MKPKQQRLIFVVAGVIFLCIAVIFVLRAFRENMVYFYSPSDLASMSPDDKKLIRIGGLVKAGSIRHTSRERINPTTVRERVNFTLTDKKSDVDVNYDGILPGLFREEQGVVAEGYLVGPKEFQATMVLTKHDEKYMPKEVVDALKKSGRWGEGDNQQ